MSSIINIGSAAASGGASGASQSGPPATHVPVQAAGSSVRRPYALDPTRGPATPPPPPPTPAARGAAPVLPAAGAAAGRVGDVAPEPIPAGLVAVPRNTCVSPPYPVGDHVKALASGPTAHPQPGTANMPSN